MCRGPGSLGTRGSCGHQWEKPRVQWVGPSEGECQHAQKSLIPDPTFRVAPHSHS